MIRTPFTLTIGAALVVLAASSQAQVSQADFNVLKMKVDAMSVQMNALSSQLSMTSSALAAAQNKITALEAKTKYLTVDASGNSIFSGTNLIVRKDNSFMEGGTNGKGNLIIGFNNLRASGNARTGSHNLILGNQNNYTGYCSIVAGFRNGVETGYSAILSGSENGIAKLKNSNDLNAFCTIITGTKNYIRDRYAFIGTGANNDIHEGSDYDGFGCFILSGQSNRAFGAFTGVLTGAYNTSNGWDALVGTGTNLVQNTSFQSGKFKTQ